jgi:hypothetical protein
VDSGVDVDASNTVDAADPVIDAPPPSTRVRIVMLSGFFGVADVPVLFQRSDDTVVAEAKTDSHGVVDIEFPEGGSTVTVLPTFSDGVKGVRTYLGVKPGDVLQVGSAFPETGYIDAVTLQLPPLPPGSQFYQLETRCDPLIELQTSSVTLRPCGSPTNFFVRDNNNHSFYTDRLTLTTGQTVDLTASVFRGPRTITVRGENVPRSELSNPGITMRISDSGLPLSTQEMVTPINNGVATADVMVPDVPTVDVTAGFSIFDSAGLKTWYRRQAPTSPIVFDLSQIAIPFVKNPTYAGNTVTWTEQGTGGDMAFAIVLVRTPADATRVDIRIWGPKTGNSLRIPTFPAPYADRNPIATDRPFVFRAGIARGPGGWDAVRRYAQLDDFFSLDWLRGDFVLSE